MTVAEEASPTSAAPSEGVGVTSHPKLIEGEVRVIGRRWLPRVHAIKAFLARSRVPYRWLDVGQDSGVVTGHGADVTVHFPDGSSLIEPDVRDVARKLGLDTEPDARSYDLVIVGGGPAGLAASIYAGSDGMRTVVVEQEVPGGQASYSAIIENYPGFPEGLSGSDLARRMIDQAERFGVEILVTRKATKLRGKRRQPSGDAGRRGMSSPRRRYSSPPAFPFAGSTPPGAPRWWAPVSTMGPPQPRLPPVAARTSISWEGGTRRGRLLCCYRSTPAGW